MNRQPVSGPGSMPFSGYNWVWGESVGMNVIVDRTGFRAPRVVYGPAWVSRPRISALLTPRRGQRLG